MKILCSVYTRTDRHIMAGKLCLTAFDNPEKRNHTDARMGGILPSFPARHGLFERPGVGKGSVTQNLLGRGDFDTFTVVHWDKNAPEWVNLLDDQPEFRMMGFREDGFPAADVFETQWIGFGRNTVGLFICGAKEPRRTHFQLLRVTSFHFSLCSGPESVLSSHFYQTVFRLHLSLAVAREVNGIAI